MGSGTLSEITESKCRLLRNVSYLKFNYIAYSCKLSHVGTLKIQVDQICKLHSVFICVLHIVNNN